MIKQFQFKISGMHCAMCTQAIEKSLSQKTGIQKIQVNLGNETAVVQYETNQIKWKEIQTIIEDLGYQINPEIIQLQIGGIHCVNCVSLIEKNLLQIEGIVFAKVHLSSEKAEISYLPGLVDLNTIQKIIEDLGYVLISTQSNQLSSQESKIKKELKAKRNRFWLGFFSGATIMGIGLWDMHILQKYSFILFIFSFPLFIYLSFPIFKAAFFSLKNKNLNMDTMYATGMGSAFAASILATFHILPGDFIFYETAILLSAFLNLGRFLETKAKARTSEAIQRLSQMQPKTAWLIKDGKDIEVPIDTIQKGDSILVKPGAQIPTDGEVIEGKSYVNESLITGEPVPVLKQQRDPVIGGTLNQNSVLIIRAQKIGRETTLAQMINLVETAQNSKPPIQKLADKWVAVFIPIVLGIAILSFLFWFVIIGKPLLFSFSALISILVIACPCALGLATPTAMTTGLGRGAELGILIKNGEVLELSQNISTIAFDKTGTLTEGKPEVIDMVCVDKDSQTMIQAAASIEKNSSHPLATAIVNYAGQNQIKTLPVSHFENIEGNGVKGQIENKEFKIGSFSFMIDNQIEISSEIQEKTLYFEKQAKTIVFVSESKRLLGLFTISDPLRKTSKEAVTWFEKLGIQTVLISGDNHHTVKAIAQETGIRTYFSKVLPQDKFLKIKTLQEKGHSVAFLGDGINDAPAIAQADIGISLGSATDIAMESAGIVLLKNDPLDAVKAVLLSRKLMSRIKTNLFWAFFYNLLLIPAAAGFLSPFGILLKPEWAGLAMAMSSVTVISLSLLLKRYRPLL